MFKHVKKAVFAGIGLVSISIERAHRIKDRLNSDLEISETEGRKCVDALARHSEKIRADVEKTVREQVKKTMEKLNVPSREEVLSLHKRLSVVEANQTRQQ